MPSMRAYWLVAGGMIAVFLALFGIVEALGVPLLTDPSEWLGRGGPVAAAIGVGLLVADVFLPVPSSIVMVAHGALFGVWTGTALSLAGSIGAAALGFAVGRRGTGVLTRLVTPASKERADALLSRWGVLAIVVSRPIPMVAETLAILAGTSTMSWTALLAGSAAGSLPPALLYALAGASSRSAASATAMFLFVMAIAGGTWWLGRRAQPEAN